MQGAKLPRFRLLMVKKVKPQEPPLPLGEGWGEGDSNGTLLSLRTVTQLTAIKEALNKWIPFIPSDPAQDRPVEGLNQSFLKSSCPSLEHSAGPCSALDMGRRVAAIG
ncbi:hypothetical protein sS8_4573 [Methylocaldum marinum]|uniref:Uncharacterized protein n=1 Tax=Methylocaldum marinum TaxID=1432792 RepID=A0A250KXV9_9GAMM|nr:hypothetical protein sS8_4573 [Methylocaldum marinum]